MKINYVHLGDCCKFLNNLEPESIDSTITSPPYWFLRDYGIAPSIWDDDPDCDHEFEIREIKERKGSASMHGRIASEQGIDCKTNESFNYISKRKEGFCSKCGAWKGTLGLEPNFDLFVKHLCDIYDLIWKVLKKTGTCWVNLGDSYGSGATTTEGYTGRTKWQHGKSREDIPSAWNKNLIKKGRNSLKGFQKCLLMIPHRFAIEMINRGWILRNVVIWHKLNAMPSSARDRFTVDFEYIFLFAKTNKTQYWINEKTFLAVNKQPLGAKGIKGKDWDWKPCKKCFGTGREHSECKECNGEGYNHNTDLTSTMCLECDGDGYLEIYENECKSCKGKGHKKHTNWQGHTYYFEPIREKSTDPESIKGRKKRNPDKYVKKGQGSMQNWDREGRKYLTKNKRTVWSISTHSNPESHFATFPPKLVIPMIESGCPKFICEKCGIPRQKIYEKNYINTSMSDTEKYNQKTFGVNQVYGRGESDYKFKGYSNCKCNAGFKPGIILDHFAGTGTTLFEAWKLGRKYIGCEISNKYYEIMNRKLDITKIQRLDDFV